MPVAAVSASRAALCVAGRDLAPPAWTGDLFGRAEPVPVLSGKDLSLDVVASGGFCLASVRVHGARSLDRKAFQEVTVLVYRLLEAELRRCETHHPVRLWNHIPGIHEPMGEDLDRYMVFNAGRYEALSAWFGGDQAFDIRVASASGVGHEGSDLVVHCLAASRPGRAVANPRQIAPYRYSRRYGPLPPCFARATVIEREGEPLVLVGGTASIVGEASVHVGDLARQTEETLTNLAVLLQAAGAPYGEDRAAVLARYRDVRIYHPDPYREDELRGLLKTAFPGAKCAEWMRADLCRPDLLVEIEGMATLAQEGTIRPSANIGTCNGKSRSPKI